MKILSSGRCLKAFSIFLLMMVFQISCSDRTFLEKKNQLHQQHQTVLYVNDHPRSNRFKSIYALVDRYTQSEGKPIGLLIQSGEPKQGSNGSVLFVTGSRPDVPDQHWAVYEKGQSQPRLTGHIVADLPRLEAHFFEEVAGRASRKDEFSIQSGALVNETLLSHLDWTHLDQNQPMFLFFLASVCGLCPSGKLVNHLTRVVEDHPEAGVAIIFTRPFDADELLRFRESVEGTIQVSSFQPEFLALLSNTEIQSLETALKEHMVIISQNRVHSFQTNLTFFRSRTTKLWSIEEAP